MNSSTSILVCLRALRRVTSCAGLQIKPCAREPGKKGPTSCEPSRTLSEERVDDGCRRADKGSGEHEPTRARTLRIERPSQATAQGSEAERRQAKGAESRTTYYAGEPRGRKPSAHVLLVCSDAPCNASQAQHCAPKLGAERPSQSHAQGYLLHWLADPALRLRAWNRRANKLRAKPHPFRRTCGRWVSPCRQRFRRARAHARPHAQNQKAIPSHCAGLQRLSGAKPRGARIEQLAETRSGRPSHCCAGVPPAVHCEPSLPLSEERVDVILVCQRTLWPDITVSNPVCPGYVALLGELLAVPVLLAGASLATGLRACSRRRSPSPPESGLVAGFLKGDRRYLLALCYRRVPRQPQGYLPARAASLRGLLA